MNGGVLLSSFLGHEGRKRPWGRSQAMGLDFFVVKCCLVGVVFFLFLDIGNRGALVLRTEGKCRIAGLPGEEAPGSQVITNSRGGAAFDLVEESGNGKG